MKHATFFRPRTAARSEAGSGAADDPIDGDSAVADPGLAGTHRAGAAREPDPGIAGRRARSRWRKRRRSKIRTRRPTRKRSWSSTRPRTTSTISSGCLNMNDEWPDHFDERPRPSSTRMEEEGDRQHDAMVNMADRPQSLHDYLIDQLGWFDLEPELRQMCERLIYSLDTNGYLKSTWKSWSIRRAAPSSSSWRSEPWPSCRSSIRRASRRTICASACCCSSRPTCRTTSSCRPSSPHTWKTWSTTACRPSSGRRAIRWTLIQKTIAELKKLKPKPGADFNNEHVPNVTPDVFVEPGEDGKYQVRLEDGRTPSLRISRFYKQLLHERAGHAAGQGVHQAKDQLRAVADRIDRAAPQHAHARGPGDRRLPDGVSQQGAGVHRAAEDAADRRQGGRARHDRQPGGRRQVDPDAARHFPAQAVLRRRHGFRQRRGSGLGHGAAEAARSDRSREQAAALQRRRAGQGAGQARPDGRPPHRHQVSQGDEDSQLAPAPRLVAGLPPRTTPTATTLTTATTKKNSREVLDPPCVLTALAVSQLFFTPIRYTPRAGSSPPAARRRASPPPGPRRRCRAKPAWGACDRWK